MLQHRSYAALDHADHGWLKARHHFAVSSCGNMAHGPVGALIVWNDDEVAPKTGFPLHGHRDVEIITYVREGILTHEDTLGSIGRIDAGDVQVMSAGRGIRHKEYNAGSTPLKIFQIWVLPRQGGGSPRWETKPFPKADRAGGFVVLASGEDADDVALKIRANARVLGATLLAGSELTYGLRPERGAYLVVAKGAVSVNGQAVGALDGIAAMHERAIAITAAVDSEVLMVDVE